MRYEYRCPMCQTRVTSDVRAERLQINCEVCGYLPLHRVYGFTYNKPMPEHFNTTVNKPISSQRQFNEELKRASEVATLETGIEHKYEPVDPGDTKHLGVTGEGLEATNRARHAMGMKEVKI